jgi:hypothetical protein
MYTLDRRTRFYAALPGLDGIFFISIHRPSACVDECRPSRPKEFPIVDFRFMTRESTGANQEETFGHLISH